MANELKLAPKDFGIVSRNPGKTPYELKELGLSNPGFEKLMAQTTTGVTPEVDPSLSEKENTPPGDESSNTPPVPPAEPEINTTGHALIPKVTAVGDSPKSAKQAPAQNKSSVALLKDQVAVKNPNGIVVAMGREFAIKLVQNDNRYSIIS